VLIDFTAFTRWHCWISVLILSLWTRRLPRVQYRAMEHARLHGPDINKDGAAGTRPSLGPVHRQRIRVGRWSRFSVLLVTGPNASRHYVTRSRGRATRQPACYASFGRLTSSTYVSPAGQSGHSLDRLCGSTIVITCWLLTYLLVTFTYLWCV